MQKLQNAESPILQDIKTPRKYFLLSSDGQPMNMNTESVTKKKIQIRILFFMLFDGDKFKEYTKKRLFYTKL